MNVNTPESAFFFALVSSGSSHYDRMPPKRKLSSNKRIRLDGGQRTLKWITELSDAELNRHCGTFKIDLSIERAERCELLLHARDGMDRSQAITSGTQQTKLAADRWHPPDTSYRVGWQRGVDGKVSATGLLMLDRVDEFTMRPLSAAAVADLERMLKEPHT